MNADSPSGSLYLSAEYNVESILLTLEVLYALLYFAFLRPRFTLTCDVCCEEFEPSDGIACQHSEDE
ncbi:hypothetical protein AAVH_36272, partial [Aphelenchoides avenae]